MIVPPHTHQVRHPELLYFLALLFGISTRGELPAPTRQPASAPAQDRVVAYAPGIRINWTAALVELDGVVVLRRGPLELFACTPGTREHESIVAVRARPRRIFEALGLIGLEPGAPPEYDEPSGRWTAARGAPLRIDVVVSTNGQERVYGIHEWVRRTDDGQPLEPRDWVFAGSRRLPGGRFAADGEGTVICVVDFDSALLALAEPHTSADAALWLEADPARIPPLGTPCVIRLSSAERGRTLIHVESNGELRRSEQLITVAELEEHLRSQMVHDPGVHALLVAQGREAREAAQALQKRLGGQGLKVLVRPAETATATQP